MREQISIEVFEIVSKHFKELFNIDIAASELKEEDDRLLKAKKFKKLFLLTTDWSNEILFPITPFANAKCEVKIQQTESRQTTHKLIYSIRYIIKDNLKKKRGDYKFSFHLWDDGDISDTYNEDFLTTSNHWEWDRPYKIKNKGK